MVLRGARFSLDKLNANEALLVYKINGEPLGAKQGYPCTNWVEGVDAQVFSKQINAYTVADDCPPDFGDSKYCAENYDGSPKRLVRSERRHCEPTERDDSRCAGRPCD